MNKNGERSEVRYEERCGLLKQQGMVVWLTGLSGAGKTTIAIELERKLHSIGKAVYRLDGDQLRAGLNSDLKFSDKDRDENIRRTTEVALMFKDAAIICIVSAISPYEKMRAYARDRIGPGHFAEVYVSTPLEECIRRDPKGLYKLALEGRIANFTGISDPYEAPKSPDLILNTTNFNVEQCAQQCFDYLLRTKV